MKKKKKGGGERAGQHGEKMINLVCCKEFFIKTHSLWSVLFLKVKITQHKTPFPQKKNLFWEKGGGFFFFGKSAHDGGFFFE